MTDGFYTSSDDSSYKNFADSDQPSQEAFEERNSASERQEEHKQDGSCNYAYDYDLPPPLVSSEKKYS